jgi:hypothetical protein
MKTRSRGIAFILPLLSSARHGEQLVQPSVQLVPGTHDAKQEPLHALLLQ